MSFQAALTSALLTAVALIVLVLASLSWDSGHRGIDQTTQLLGSEIALSLDNELAHLFRAPVNTVEMFVGQVQRGELSFDDPERLRLVLFDTLKATPDLSLLAFSDDRGETLTVVRVADGIRLELAVEGRGYHYDSWALDEDGQPTGPRTDGEFYEASKRPWYKAAASSARPAWSDVYAYFGMDQLVLDVSYAVRDPKGGLIGVLNCGFVLSALETTLANIADQYGAVAFVIEDSGALLVTSEGGAARRLPDRSVERIQGQDSGDPVVAAASAHVFSQGLESGRISVDETPYDVFVTPVGANLAEDWSAVIAVPRSRFSEPLRDHLQAMLVMTLVFLAFAALFGLALARFLSTPITELTGKARLIEGGNLDVTFSSSRLREFDQLAGALTSMVSGLEQRDRMRDAFARYVSPRLVRHVLNDPSQLEPGGQVIRASVMFTDLRGYTAITERLGSARTVEVLNQYLSQMLTVVDAHDGFVTDMLGDGLLIVFGIEAEDEGALQAVECGMHMHRELEAVAETFQQRHGVHLEMGIGIHCGEVVLGNIGTAQRAKYGVVGDTVNTAARVESLTVGGEILVTGAVVDACGGALGVGPARDVPLKGKRDPLRVYDIRSLGDQTLDGTLPSVFTQVQQPVGVRTLEGKQLSEQTWSGQIVAVEDRFFMLRTEVVLRLGMDLRVDAGEHSIYGRVQETGDECLIRCTGGTATPPELIAQQA